MTKKKPAAPLRAHEPSVTGAEVYSITEWKLLFGEPGGGGTTPNGRITGCTRSYFPTEPDYCEDAA